MHSRYLGSVWGYKIPQGFYALRLSRGSRVQDLKRTTASFSKMYTINNIVIIKLKYDIYTIPFSSKWRILCTGANQTSMHA